ncbi:hypothetical protein F5Y04DRAFT_175138 [Hypomontagnella monticulosa]|nr:hypothetical protein F5Y04DRAFT_175138 [Hypomontagnella monticulosa]
MADPLTILGATAAGLQLVGTAAKGLLGTIKLIQDVKDIPARMSQALSYINRELKSINDLLHEDSPIFVHLTTEQYARISTPAIEARKAMENIQRTLQPLVDASQGPTNTSERGKAITRVWKSLVTVKKEKEIRDMMDFLERLNTSLLREIQISGFQTQSLLRNQTSHILETVTASATDIQETRQLAQHTNSLQSQVLQAAKSGETSISQKLDLLRRDTIESRESLGQSLALTSESFHHVKDDLSGLRHDVSDSIRSSSSQIEAHLVDHRIELRSTLETTTKGLLEDIRAHDIASRAKLVRDIRNELGALLATSATQQNRTRGDNLIGIGSPVFDINLRHATVRLEASSCQTKLEPGVENEAKRSTYLKLPRCKCRAGTSTSQWTYGRIGFRLETQVVRSCPIHGKKRGRSFSVEAKLSPFLKGTLELTLGLLSGRKGWEIAPLLKFRATVKRSESPIFQLFDHFVETWGTLQDYETYRNSMQRHAIINIDINSRRFALTWDDRLLMKGFSNLVHGIIESLESNQASGTDIDEYGRTLLTEIISLVLILPEKIEFVISDLNRLIQLTRDLKVDPMAKSRLVKISYPITKDSSDLFNSELKMTPMHMLFSRWKFQPSRSLVFETISKIYDGLYDSLGGYPWFILETYYTNPPLEQLSRTRIEIAEGLGFSDLCLAIIRQSLPDMKRIYFADVENQRKIGRSRDRGDLPAPIELAVGWPDGLRFLVDEGHYVAHAFDIACRTSDEESASILLSTDEPIFSQHYHSQGPTWAFCSQNNRFLLLVTQELRRRRKAIQVLALQHFTKQEKVGLGLSESWDLDENGQQIYLLLQQKTHVPDKLDCLEMRSPYCSAGFMRYRSTCLERYNIIYDNGFTRVDLPCHHGCDPLAEFCKKNTGLGSTFHETELWSHGVIWFLERGANPNFSCLGDGWDRCQPHLVFYLASLGDVRGVDKRIIHICCEKLVTNLTDTQCNCLCSLSGCTPASFLWDYNSSDENMYHRERILRRWIRALSLFKMQKEHYYRAICRLEIFQRLGMTHTCCRTLYEFDKADEKELRSEERVSARQLQKLLQLYRAIRKILFSYPIEEFWIVWWEAVDRILPPLSREELWDYTDDNTCGTRRDERWAKVLHASGYEGWDFEDVIKFHLTGFFLKCKALIERRVYWKRHRLVASPKPIWLRQSEIRICT